MSSVEARVLVYGNVQTTSEGRDSFPLGLEQFRDYITRYLMSDFKAKYRCGKPTAVTGDTIVFAFKGGSEWFFVGDGVVISKWRNTEDGGYRWNYRLGGVRIYPRSVAFRELGVRGKELVKRIQIATQLSAEEYLQVLFLSAAPESIVETNQ